MYLAFSSITGESTVPRMTRSDQMEEEILIVDLKFPETAFYIVIVLVILSPKTFNTLSLKLFLLPLGLWACPQTFKVQWPTELGKWYFVSGGAATHHIMKTNFLKLLNIFQGFVLPKRIVTFYRY